MVIGKKKGEKNKSQHPKESLFSISHFPVVYVDV